MDGCAVGNECGDGKGGGVLDFDADDAQQTNQINCATESAAKIAGSSEGRHLMPG